MASEVTWDPYSIDDISKEVERLWKQLTDLKSEEDLPWEEDALRKYTSLGTYDCSRHPIMLWGRSDKIHTYDLGRWVFDEEGARFTTETRKTEIPELNLSDSDKDALINLVMGVKPG